MNTDTCRNGGREGGGGGEGAGGRGRGEGRGGKGEGGSERGEGRGGGSDRHYTTSEAMERPIRHKYLVMFHSLESKASYLLP